MARVTVCPILRGDANDVTIESKYTILMAIHLTIATV